MAKPQSVLVLSAIEMRDGETAKEVADEVLRPPMNGRRGLQAIIESPDDVRTTLNRTRIPLADSMRTPRLLFDAMFAQFGMTDEEWAQLVEYGEQRMEEKWAAEKAEKPVELAVYASFGRKGASPAFYQDLAVVDATHTDVDKALAALRQGLEAEWDAFAAGVRDRAADV